MEQVPPVGSADVAAGAEAEWRQATQLATTLAETASSWSEILAGGGPTP